MTFLDELFFSFAQGILFVHRFNVKTKHFLFLVVTIISLYFLYTDQITVGQYFTSLLIYILSLFTVLWVVALFCAFTKIKLFKNIEHWLIYKV